MKRLILITLLIAPFVCNGGNGKKELIDQYVTEFFSDCARYGVQFEYKSLTVSIARLDGQHHGISVRDKEGNVSVTIDKFYVSTNYFEGNKLAIKMAVYHELAHGVLEMHHKKGIHIMNPEMFQSNPFRRCDESKLIEELFTVRN